MEFYSAGLQGGLSSGFVEPSLLRRVWEGYLGKVLVMMSLMGSP